MMYCTQRYVLGGLQVKSSADAIRKCKEQIHHTKIYSMSKKNLFIYVRQLELKHPIENAETRQLELQ